jgi:branched-chain amino acid aminotransferase
VEDNAMPGRGKINGAYVNSCLAGDQARSDGYDECLLLNEDGHVCEASGMNVFMVRGGRLITTPIYGNILEGITRDSLLNLARAELGIECLERPIDRSELYIADELFICGTAAKVVSARSVDRRLVGSGETGPITKKLGELYNAAVRGELSAYRHWLTPVWETT